MTNQLQDPLTDVVGRFVAAESTLDGLRIRQAELREASAQLNIASSEMGQRTDTSVEAPLRSDESADDVGQGVLKLVGHVSSPVVSAVIGGSRASIRLRRYTHTSRSN